MPSASAANRTARRTTPRPSARRGLGVVVIALAFAELEQAATPQVTIHSPDGGLQHLADLARLEVPELVPGELFTLFVVGAVEKHGVDVRVEPHVARRPLHDGDRACLRRAARGARGAESLDGRHEDARERAEELAVAREATPPRKRKREHPLPESDLR